MKISFDLDDTIVPGNKSFTTEHQTPFQKLLGIEPIRIGTIKLFKELKRRNHEIGIYTTSFRSFFRIKFLFLSNGFVVNFIINQKSHSRKLNEENIQCSKYPPAFNIDLHIDDSIGVEIEGQKYGFETIIVDEREPDWVNLILKRSELMKIVK